MANKRPLRQSRVWYLDFPQTRAAFAQLCFVPKNQQLSGSLRSCAGSLHARCCPGAEVPSLGMRRGCGDGARCRAGLDLGGCWHPERGDVGVREAETLREGARLSVEIICSAEWPF